MFQYLRLKFLFQYLRLNWVKTIKYPINVSFCNIVLFYTSCIYAITLTIMFYAGCDSCHVAKAPPKSTESTTLVHPDKVCWWGEKACKYFDICLIFSKL